MVDSTVDSGPWLTLAEAARALGVSEKTARRRAKAGQLDARQIPSPRGPTWQVRVPNGVPFEGTVDSTLDSGQGRREGTQDHAATMLELVRLVAELQPRAEAAAMWQGRAEVLAERLAAAESRILALAAPSESVPVAQETPHPVEPTTDARMARLRALAPWPLAVLAIVAVVVLLIVR